MVRVTASPVSRSIVGGTSNDGALQLQMLMICAKMLAKEWQGIRTVMDFAESMTNSIAVASSRLNFDWENINKIPINASMLTQLPLFVLYDDKTEVASMGIALLPGPFHCAISFC